MRVPCPTIPPSSRCAALYAAATLRVRGIALVAAALLAACATAPPAGPAPDEAAAARAAASVDALERGEAALAAGDLEQAEFYLSAAESSLPASERQRLSEARRRLAALRSDPTSLILAEAAATLEAGEPDTAAAVELLQRLERVPGERLSLEAQQPTRLGLWCDFALDVRDTLVSRRDLLQAAADWSTLHPLHPVDSPRYLEIAWQYGQRFAPPERVAVLLPKTGDLAAAGAAVRDGIVSAWIDHPTRSELVFFDAGETAADALAAYRRAQDDGFAFVIGPLRREAVALISEQPGVAVPGLMLNEPETEVLATPFEPANATAPPATEADFRFVSLSQEAEARAVAERMLAAGQRQAILLLADSRWGERAESAFMDAYLAGGGEIVSLERFDTDTADHSDKLTRLLQIQDGRDRRRRLQSLLNIPLEFEDSRRDDFEAFFMAADPSLGKQLKPQLRFFDAGKKPVYAMSRVYSGSADPSVDKDLNGVIIPATRWALSRVDVRGERGHDTGGPPLSSLRGGAFGKLHALGRDAWNVLPWLDLMTRDPDFAFPGALGDLTLGPGGRLRIAPAWAVFRRGRLAALEPAAPLPAPPAQTGTPASPAGPAAPTAP